MRSSPVLTDRRMGGEAPDLMAQLARHDVAHVRQVRLPSLHGKHHVLRQVGTTHASHTSCASDP